jgi:hypothetical protein
VLLGGAHGKYEVRRNSQTFTNDKLKLQHPCKMSFRNMNAQRESGYPLSPELFDYLIAECNF